MVLAWIALLGGCKSVQNLPDLGDARPEVGFEQLKIKRVDFDRIDSVFLLTVDNPWPVKVQVASQAWSLKLGGADFLDGSGGRGARIAANGRSQVRIAVGTRWEDVFTGAQVAAGQDDVPYALDATLGFDTPAGEVEVPFHHEGAFPVLHPPMFRIEAIRMVSVDGGGQIANLALDLELGTDQGSPIAFDAIDFRLLLEDTLIASGRASQADVRTRRILSIPFQIGLLNLPAGLATAVRNGRSVDVQFQATAKVATPHGDVPMNIRRSRTMGLR